MNEWTFLSHYYFSAEQYTLVNTLLYSGLFLNWKPKCICQTLDTLQYVPMEWNETLLTEMTSTMNGWRHLTDFKLATLCVSLREVISKEGRSGKVYSEGISSVSQSLSRVRLSATHESQHARAPCPSPSPGVHSDSHPLSQWCHPAISSSVVPFSSCPPSLPASKSFPMIQLLAWGGRNTGVSALASFRFANMYLSKYIVIDS